MMAQCDEEVDRRFDRGPSMDSVHTSQSGQRKVP